MYIGHFIFRLLKLKTRNFNSFLPERALIIQNFKKIIAQIEKENLLKAIHNNGGNFDNGFNEEKII